MPTLPDQPDLATLEQHAAERVQSGKAPGLDAALDDIAVEYGEQSWAALVEQANIFATITAGRSEEANALILTRAGASRTSVGLPEDSTP